MRGRGSGGTFLRNGRIESRGERWLDVQMLRIVACLKRWRRVRFDALSPLMSEEKQKLNGEDGLVLQEVAFLHAW